MGAAYDSPGSPTALGFPSGGEAVALPLGLSGLFSVGRGISSSNSTWKPTVPHNDPSQLTLLSRVNFLSPSWGALLFIYLIIINNYLLYLNVIANY